jgi:hypothetical protein
MQVLLGHTAPVTGVSFMRDEGSLLVSSSAIGERIGWDALSGGKVYSLREPDTETLCQLALPNGALALGCTRGAVLIVDRLTGELRHALATASAEVSGRGSERGCGAHIRIRTWT